MLPCIGGLTFACIRGGHQCSSNEVMLPQSPSCFACLLSVATSFNDYQRLGLSSACQFLPVRANI